ncbi:MAG: hypothetical protein Q9184_004228 [Pyrenodesmia sp. 2 TL-2023]
MTCDLDRPCARCVKRNIGHMCHDEPRELTKNAKLLPGNTGEADNAASKQDNPTGTNLLSTVDEQQAGQQLLQEPDLDLNTTAPTDVQTSPAQLAETPPASEAPCEPPGTKGQPLLGPIDWNLGEQSQFQDMHNFHPSYMFNAPEVTNEYNLLNDFLNTSLLDDGAMYSGDDAQGLYSDPSLINTVATSANGHRGHRSLKQIPRYLGRTPTPAASAGDIEGSSSMMPTDKARETYYMTAADPAGNDTPEERMEKLLKAKYRAGMLRPFNYVKGYARLNEYMDRHMQPSSRQKIRRELDRFRPKFRERMQSLTDMELVLVEMWFERSLMEYDRVFASMAIPACCWRRTGEICRGNKEMAQLIHVPIEQLRDGKLAVHEIIVEDHLVSYWEKFGTIAFDNSQKAMLTSCSLKNPNMKSNDPEIRCCFSFTIRRDTYDMSRLESILAFAAKLERTLRQAIEKLPSLTDALYQNIESIDLISASAVATKSRDLDDRGTTIWNLTAKHKEDTSLGDILALTRAFASLLLDRAQQLQFSAAANDIRVLKITLKASKRCLDRQQLGVTERIIERAAFYEDRIQRFATQDDSATNLAATSRRLCTEYHVLRIASQEWRRGRLDLADIWLTRLGHEKIVLEAAVVEHLADTLFEIGRDQAKRQRFKSALQWLERAHNVFLVHDQEGLSTDGSALKCSIRHCLVHALLKERGEENNERARNIIHELEIEGENTVAVSLLKLQVLTGDFSTAQDYYDMLLQVIRQIHLSDVNLRTILHHVHELKRRSARLAHTALVLLVSERLLAMDEMVWMEKTVITLVWNCATSVDLAEMTDQLEALLNEVASVHSSAFSASATHAAQIVCTLTEKLRVLFGCHLADKANALCDGQIRLRHMPLIARLLVEELDSQQSPEIECIDELCKVFEGAVAAAQACQQDTSTTDAFSPAELDWFSRNSFNLALKMCTTWKAEATLRIVQACSTVRDQSRWERDLSGADFIQFIHLYPADTDPQQASDLTLRRLFCNFLRCCLLIVLARAEDIKKNQLHYYSQLRTTMHDFRTSVNAQLSTLQGGARADLLRKYACLVALDFEAAAKLGIWTSFGGLVEKETEICGDPKIYDVIVDMVLNCEAPTEVLIATLQQVVNKVWQPDNGDINRLARWIRCLLSLALSSNIEMAENIVDQVISIAENAKEKPTRYPAEELEWIATTTFNRAIDFYCASQDEASRRWAEKAISLADFGDDDGQLHELLQNKYLGLAWDR